MGAGHIRGDQYHHVVVVGRGGGEGGDMWKWGSMHFSKKVTGPYTYNYHDTFFMTNWPGKGAYRVCVGGGRITLWLYL